MRPATDWEQNASEGGCFGALVLLFGLLTAACKTAAQVPGTIVAKKQ